MAVRATSDKVAGLVGDELDPIASDRYNAAIELANGVVDEYLGTQGLTEPQLARIETLLAAHFVELSKGPLTRYKVGESDEAYRQPASTMSGLLSTNWGQQAVAFDPTGILSGVASATPKAEFRVV